MLLRFLSNHVTKAVYLLLFAFLLATPLATEAGPLKSGLSYDHSTISQEPPYGYNVFLPPVTRTDTWNHNSFSHNLFLPMVIKSTVWNSNPFGFESESSLTNGSLAQKVDDLNPGWARLNRRISWRDLQPVEGGPIQWSLLADFETELRLLSSQYVKPIIIIDDYPRWATIAENSCSPLRENKFAAFASFAQALVARYSNSTFNVYDWELGNEVDVDQRLVPLDSQFGCWGNIDDKQYYGGDYYGKMVKVVGAAIKGQNPAARVWLGGLMVATPVTTDPNLGKPENFIRGILAVGAAPYFDVVSYHGHVSWYGSRKDGFYNTESVWYPYGGGNIGKARFLKGILQEYGVNKTLFLSEAGVGCPESVALCENPPESFFEYQADEGIRLIVPVVNEPDIEGFIWYQLPGPGWRSSGLLTGNYQPKPIYTAYQELVEATWGSTVGGKINYGDGLEAYEFRKGNTLIHIVWTKTDVTLPISIPTNQFIRAVDRDGNAITPQIIGDFAVLRPTFSPIYVFRHPGFQSVSAVWPNAQEVGAQEVALFRKDFFSQTQP